MPDKTVRDWLIRQLARNQWTQADLARHSGISAGRISEWMTGKRPPSPQSCQRLADALHADVDACLELAGHRPQPLRTNDPELKALIALMYQIRWDRRSRRYIRSLLEDMVDLDREEEARSQSRRAPQQ